MTCSKKGCGCEPRFVKDKRYRAGGFWRCRAHEHEYSRRPERMAARNAWGRGYYHDPENAAWVLRKLMRKQLRDRRERLEQLTGGS